jgi:Predicted phosphatases
MWAALNETSCPVDDAVMIGDTIYDIEMAAAAGVRAIGVAWGYHEPDALGRAGASAVVESFDQLGSILNVVTRRAA